MTYIYVDLAFAETDRVALGCGLVCLGGLRFLTRLLLSAFEKFGKQFVVRVIANFKEYPNSDEILQVMHLILELMVTGLTELALVIL